MAWYPKWQRQPVHLSTVMHIWRYWTRTNPTLLEKSSNNESSHWYLEYEKTDCLACTKLRTQNWHNEPGIILCTDVWQHVVWSTSLREKTALPCNLSSPDTGPRGACAGVKWLGSLCLDLSREVNAYTTLFLWQSPGGQLQSHIRQRQTATMHHFHFSISESRSTGHSLFLWTMQTSEQVFRDIQRTLTWTWTERHAPALPASRSQCGNIPMPLLSSLLCGSELMSWISVLWHAKPALPADWKESQVRLLWRSRTTSSVSRITWPVHSEVPRQSYKVGAKLFQ